MSGDHCKIIVDEESGQVSLEDTRLVSQNVLEGAFVKSSAGI